MFIGFLFIPLIHGKLYEDLMTVGLQVEQVYDLMFHRANENSHLIN